VNYWMLSMPEEHFNVTRDQGYKVQGFGIRQRRKTDRMVKGDKLLFYVKGLRVFPVAVTIISTVFEDETPLWLSTQANELYKYRVRTRAELILRPDQYLQANQIAPRMEYVRRWPPEMWPHAFWEELHLLPRKDFELIEEEMRKVLRGQGPIPAPPPSVIATAAMQVSEPLGLELQDSEGATA
jgi:hypothetical protein